MSSHTEAAFTLAPTGDAILTRSVLPQADEGLAAVVDRLRAADATVTNLEAVAADGSGYATPPRAVADQYQYLASFPGMVLRCPPALLDELGAMGVDAVSTASNHAADFGRRGMASTMRELEARDVPYAGLGRTLPDARAPAYVTTPGGRVGLVNACTSVAPGSEAGAPSSLLPGRPGISPLHVNWTYRVTRDRLEALREIGEAAGIDAVRDTWTGRTAADDGAGYRFMHMRFVPVDDASEEGIDHSLEREDREAVLAAVRDADAGADWVVAAVHAHHGPAGSRNVPETPAFLEAFARDCVDAGADAVVGTGPHVLRGIEVYDGSPILYSLGNLFCQFETIDRLPAESFDYYGVDDDRHPSAVFDARYYEDGEPTGNLANPDYWRTVIPTCSFGADGRLDRIDLLPCSLGRTRSRPNRGTPRRATGESAAAILETLAERSAEYGTTVEQDGDLGRIVPETA